MNIKYELGIQNLERMKGKEAILMVPDEDWN